ncbi:MAG TPA: DUF2142 domain-containing protein [Jatrophihabitans sp.]|jgi:4-amino-4-deoxy-L-arabinose transferase-like glycosyltransferase
MADIGNRGSDESAAPQDGLTFGPHTAITATTEHTGTAVIEAEPAPGGNPSVTQDPAVTEDPALTEAPALWQDPQARQGHRRNWTLAAPGRVRRAWTSLPVVVWLITGLWGCLLAAATIVWPVGYGLDESAHIDMSYAYSHSLHLYGPAERTFAAAIGGFQHYYTGHPPSPSLAKASLPPRGERPTFNQLGGNAPNSTGVDQMVQHPPAYYLLGAAVFDTPGVSRLAFDQQIALVRLVSLLLILPIPALAWATAKRLGARPPVAVGAAAVVLGIPGLIRVGSSVTNDSLIVLSGGVLTYLAARVMTGDTRRRTAGWIAFWLCVALLTKAFGGVFPFVVLAAYLVQWRTTRRLPVVQVLICAAGGALGALWWLRNVIVYGHLQPGGWGEDFEANTFKRAGKPGQIHDYLPGALVRLISRVWDGLGIPDRPSQPPLLVWGWVFLAMVGLLAALLIRQKAAYGRAKSVVMVLPLVLTAVVVVTAEWHDYFIYHVYAGLQGRYLYPGIVGVAAAVVVGLQQLLLPQFRRGLAVGTTILALVGIGSSFFLVGRAWFANGSVTLVGSLHEAAGTMLRISPWPQWATLLPFVGAVLLAVVTVAAIARMPDGDDADPGGHSAFKTVEPLDPAPVAG